MFAMEVEVKCFFVDVNDSGALLEMEKAISANQFAAIKDRLKCGLNGRLINGVALKSSLEWDLKKIISVPVRDK